MTTFFEKMATRETGRPMVSTRETAAARMAAYPQRLAYTEIIKCEQSQRKYARYYLFYQDTTASLPVVVRGLMRFLGQVVRILRACSSVDLYIFSPHKDWVSTLAAAALCRLIGRSITLHDYCFQTSSNSRSMRIIHSLSDHIVVGDAASADDILSNPTARISTRNDAVDIDYYRSLRKKKAVPRVIVYGNFENEKIMALAVRTHDLIKQKYPRTEFVPTSLMTIGTDISFTGHDSMTATSMDSEDRLRELYADIDILMLLSPGGLNRLFGQRAIAAGYPIITNGFEFPCGEQASPVMASRDSYSSLADAVIRMVDDENYYCSLSRP